MFKCEQVELSGFWSPQFSRILSLAAIKSLRELQLVL